MRHVLLVIAATAAVHADPAKYTRTPVRIDATLSSRVAPIRPTPPRRRPSTTADDVMRGEELAEPIRREQEAVLAQLVSDTPDDDPQKADYIFRLAELYAMQARFWRLQAH
jgi:hypothetical protein